MASQRSKRRKGSIPEFQEWQFARKKEIAYLSAGGGVARGITWEPRLSYPYMLIWQQDPCVSLSQHGTLPVAVGLLSYLVHGLICRLGIEVVSINDFNQ